MTPGEKKPDDLEALRAILDALEPFNDIDRQRIFRWAGEKLNLSAIVPTGRRNEVIPEPAPAFVPHADKPATNIKSFVAEKGPKSDNQFAAAAAYYYRFEAPELERKQSIGAQDLLDACRLAGWRRMGDPAKTLSNAQGVGLLNKTERGQYTISSVGENLVAMTLSGETAKAPSKRHRKSKKKAKK